MGKSRQSAPSTERDRSSSGPVNVAKGRIEEKEGDDDFSAEDWLGASVSYESALKYYGSRGSNADRVQRKMTVADCREALGRAKKYEQDGDVGKAIAALQGGQDACETSNTEAAFVLEKIDALRERRDASRKAGAVTQTRRPDTPAPKAPMLDSCAILGTPVQVSSMCDFKEGHNMFRTPVRSNPVPGCPAELIVRYIDPDTLQIAEWATNRRGNHIETCVSGVVAVQVK